MSKNNFVLFGNDLNSNTLSDSDITNKQELGDLGKGFEYGSVAQSNLISKLEQQNTTASYALGKLVHDTLDVDVTGTDPQSFADNLPKAISTLALNSIDDLNIDQYAKKSQLGEYDSATDTVTVNKALTSVSDQDGNNIVENYTKKADLANVAFSGEFSDLKNIPEAATQGTNKVLQRVVDDTDSHYLILKRPNNESIDYVNYSTGISVTGNSGSLSTQGSLTTNQNVTTPTIKSLNTKKLSFVVGDTKFRLSAVSNANNDELELATQKHVSNNYVNKSDYSSGYNTLQNAITNASNRTKLIFTGSVNTSYDGSGTEDITVNIPSVQSYVLPPAQNITLGGVKIGSNISYQTDGTISLTSNNVIKALGFTPVDDSDVVDLTSNQSIGGSKSFTNYVEAPGFNVTSDRRLKSDIADFDCEISSLHAKKYVLKTTNKQSVGLIAQDVQAIEPTLVNTNQSTGYLSIDYSGLVAILVNKVNALQHEVNELKKKLND